MNELEKLLEQLKNGDSNLKDTFGILERIEGEVVKVQAGIEEKPTGFFALILYYIRRFFRNLFGGGGPEKEIKKANSKLLDYFNRPYVDKYSNPEVADFFFNRSMEEYRLVNSAITKILLKSGDKSTLPQVLDYLGQGEEQGTTDRVSGFLCTKALRVDDLSILEKLFAMLDTAGKAAHVTRNLNLLELPAAPVNQEVKIPELLARMDLKFSSLKEEITLIRDKSAGKLQVEQAVWAEIDRVEKTKIRGDINYEDWWIGLILETELNHFELDYFIEGGKATVCTLATAVNRWKKWWQQNRSRLKFDQARGHYVLA